MQKNLMATSDNNAFAIEGNIGFTSAISELLLQSHRSFLDVLPALPPMWKNGHVHGLCGRGGVRVDIEWEGGNLSKLVLRSKIPTSFKIRYRKFKAEAHLEPGKETQFGSDLTLI